MKKSSKYLTTYVLTTDAKKYIQDISICCLVTSKIDSWTWVRVLDLGRGPVLFTDLLTVFGRMVRWATITTCLPL